MFMSLFALTNDCNVEGNLLALAKITAAYVQNSTNEVSHHCLISTTTYLVSELLSFSFQFFTRLGAVFAEEVCDFGVFVVLAISNGVLPKLISNYIRTFEISSSTIIFLRSFTKE